MKSLMLLWQEAAKELAARCGTSTTRDFLEVSRRMEHEGLSFLTIALPAFGKDFEKSLDQGKVDRCQFSGFRKKGGLPLFLGGFLDLVFHRGTGLLLEDPHVEAIFAIRQLTLMVSKLFLPTSSRRENAAMRGFIECEQDVKRSDAVRTYEEIHTFRQVSNLLWGDVLSRVDNDLYEEQERPRYHSHDASWPILRPKHGPGATADKLSGNRKFDQAEWPRRLEEVFPSGEYLLPNWRYYYRHDRVAILEPGAERPVRVVAVPKTMKTPRIIAIEPTCMQYMQQAIKTNLVEHIEGSSMGSFVGFTDQGPNRAMACEGSLTENLATLDLSEASDRVSNQLVRTLLEMHPLTARAVDATRSRKADVRGHGVIRLAKFASMGSALTFPIEAMVFATVIFIGIQNKLNRPLTRRDIASFRGQVRVYGDDIVVPVEFVPSVIQSLTDFGFVVNMGKSFWSGKFRESCGKEYYDGHDISIVKVRQMFPTSRKNVREIESLVALRNNFYLQGMWLTARWLDGQIRPLLGGHYPNIAVTEGEAEEPQTSRSPLLGRFSFLTGSIFGQISKELDPYLRERTDRKLFTPLVRGWMVKHRIPQNKCSGEGALLKVLSQTGDEPFADERHLERSGRPDAVSIKLRWARPY